MEEQRADLAGPEAVGKLKEIVNQAPTCFFLTIVATGDSNGARPMNVREVDDEGNLWFLSSSESHKNKELALDPAVRLLFQGSEHSDFLMLSGRATLTTDRDKIKALWSPVIQTWFTDGVDDPRITVIKVVPYDGYYWDTKHGRAVAGAKMLLGAVLRKTMDDSIQGRLDP
jgi:general stress protein 26